MSNHLFSFVQAAAGAGERPFLETPQGRTLSYGDVLTGSSGFANTLVALGVKPGDRVAVQVEKSPEALLLYLGCVRTGAVFLPLNTAYTATELDYFIGDAEPSLLVCDPAKREALAAIAKKAKTGAVENTLNPPWFAPTELARFLRPQWRRPRYKVTDGSDACSCPRVLQS